MAKHFCTRLHSDARRVEEGGMSSICSVFFGMTISVSMEMCAFEVYLD